MCFLSNLFGCGCRRRNCVTPRCGDIGMTYVDAGGRESCEDNHCHGCSGHQHNHGCGCAREVCGENRCR